MTRGASGVGHLFLLFTQDYLSEHSYSHTKLILLIAYVFPVTCTLLSVCLCGWSNSNVPLIYLTIRTLTLPHEFMFVFIRYLIGAILSEKSCQKHGVWKKYKKDDSPVGGLPIEGGFKQYAHYNIEGWKGDLGALNYWGDLNWRGDIRPLSIPWLIFCMWFWHTQIYLIQFISICVVRHTWAF